jgi:hypothetical protein
VISWAFAASFLFTVLLPFGFRIKDAVGTSIPWYAVADAATAYNAMDQHLLLVVFLKKVGQDRRPHHLFLLVISDVTVSFCQDILSIDDQFFN